MNKMKVNISPSPSIHLSLNTQNPELINVNANVAGGTRDYNRLLNKPQINGITLMGNMTLADLNIVSENTQAGWEADPMYVPKAGEICLYSDTGRLKVGDGSVPIIDLPFIGDADNQRVLDALQQHVTDMHSHVSQEDRDRWDAKLNYDTVGEELIFTRL